MLRTRAGYCGGEKEKPTYRAMGDHTEAVSIDYDATVVSYEDLLEAFWAGHRCDSLNRSTQYLNAVFYRDEKQKEAALKSLEDVAECRGLALERVGTKVQPVNHFTYAEGYHQKYALSRTSESRLFLESVYPSAKELADSSVATRLNAYLGSGMKKDWAAFAEELSRFGLPESLEERLQANALSQV